MVGVTVLREFGEDVSGAFGGRAIGLVPREGGGEDVNLCTDLAQ